MPSEAQPNSINHNDTHNDLTTADKAETSPQQLPSWEEFKVDPSRYSPEVHNALAQQLITAGEADTVARNFNMFHGLDSFHDLDSTTAQQLIAAGAGQAVINNLNKFQGLDHNWLVDQLIAHGDADDVAECFDRLHGMDHHKRAEQLLAKHIEGSLVENLEKFHGIDDLHAKIAQGLVDEDDEDQTGLEIISENIGKFSELDDAIVLQLLETYPLLVIQHYRGALSAHAINKLAAVVTHSDDVADSVVENIGRFKPESVNKLLQACTSHYSTAQKIKQLDLAGLGLNEQQQTELLEHIATLKPELKGVSKQNPYARHHNSVERIPSGSEDVNQNARLANQLAEMLKHPEEVIGGKDSVESINTHILKGYENLKDALSKQIGQPKMVELLGGKPGQLPDMLPTFRRLVVEWMVLQAGGDQEYSAQWLIDTTNDMELDAAIAYATEKFVQVLKVDTQYYDHLYREWDHKRVSSMDFEEVFLGRDGVYAYVGRVGQIMARRAAVRLRGQSLSNTERQLLQMPTYLVYPRGFRDYLEDDVKEIYLNQKLRNPASASYYDTGFTGTIPQDIMQILGIPRDQWESKIRLLSATARERTVTGLKGGKSERDQVVNTIEYNVKPEKSAEGLYMRQQPGQTEAMLVPYAEPTDPGERLAFRLVQQALYRHYYLQETKRLENQEHILGISDETIRRADGAQVHMRLDTSLDATSIAELSKIFGDSDVGTRLAQQATAIKIAGSTDPYPNEAVYEMSLSTNSDSRDVIIKAIVPEKVHGPLDEYAALRLLDSLGIESAKPVARIFLPGDEGNGFVVMDKLPGESGRLLEQRLQKHGVAEQRVQNLMNEALQKMEEIAEQVRSRAGLDKPWRLKDFMVEFSYDANGVPKTIKRLIPIDFERARVYDPDNPATVKL